MSSLFNNKFYSSDSDSDFESKKKEKKNNCKEKKNDCKDESEDIPDYIVVGGTGHAGSIISYRLSESGKYRVRALDVGKDDAKTTPSLPLLSPANVPQPGQYQWNKYIRGGFLLYTPLNNRGFCAFSWFMNSGQNDGNIHSIGYDRATTWGGCTSHNFDISTRQSPFNWDEWVALGLVEYSAANMVQWYKKVQNRTQTIYPGFAPAYPQYTSPSPPTPYYTSSLPVGVQGNTGAESGTNGMLPTLWFNTLGFNPPLGAALKTAITSLNSSGFNYYDPGANYLYDISTQDRILSARGGLGTPDLSVLDQNGTIIPNGEISVITAVQFNQRLYGDNGFVFPPELTQFGQSGLSPYERMSTANTYLYAALGRKNLKIDSEILVTKLIVKGKKSKNPKIIGVEYLQGWNIYQTGRNPNTNMSGYGGSAGDARANAIEAKMKGIKKLFAKKEVILSASVFNSPQIMMLSGFGPANDLKAVGIKVIKDIPGVGKNMQDNMEIFPFTYTNAFVGNAFYTASIKPTPSYSWPNWELILIGSTPLNLTIMESDVTIQYSWLGVKNGSGANQLFERNSPDTILNDFSNTNNPLVYNGPNGQAYGYITGTVGASGSIVTGTGTKFKSIVPSPGVDMAPPIPPNNTYIAFVQNPSTTPTFYQVQSIDTDTQITLVGTPGLSIPSGTIYTLYYGNGFKPRSVSPQNIMFWVMEKENQAQSLGSVKLQSSDPTIPPILSYTDDQIGLNADIDEMYNVVYNNWLPMLLSLSISTDSNGNNYFGGLLDPSPSDILKPGINNFTNMNQIDPVKLKTWLKKHFAGHHACCTLKMGVDTDLMAVCDPHGRVRGIKGLRVADISVLPIAGKWPNQNLNPIIEKIAQDILNDA